MAERDHTALAKELSELSEQQREAVRRAAYLPMSKPEANKFDERQQRIHELNVLLNKR